MVQPDRFQFVRGAAVDIDAAHANRPGARALKSDDVPQQRGFAGSAATEQHHHLPRLDIQIHAIQHAVAPIDYGQVLD
jgi:hypothetical protein